MAEINDILQAAIEKCGSDVFIIPGSCVRVKISGEVLPLLDIAVVSGDFALPGHSAEQALADLAGYGIPRLARTRGGQPVQVLIGEQQREFPVPQVAVVDTLGAGDVLHGALAAHLAGEADFTSSLQRAIELASRSVTGRGVLAALA